VNVNPWKRSSAASAVPSPYFEGLNIGIDVNYGNEKKKIAKKLAGEENRDRYIHMTS
jgi:hypothetical protein